MANYKYVFNCVACPNPNCTSEELDSLIDRMREITVSTFKRALGSELINELRAQFGMQRGGSKTGVTREGDYHVRFFTVLHRSKKAYVMVHSAIEYVYLPKSH